MHNVILQDKPQNIETWLSALGLPSADRDYKPGHERVLALIDTLQKEGFVFHQPKLRIRVAGTNGKGSTSHFLAAAFKANGWSVGLYTSPHIRTFHERMRVDGEAIPESTLLDLMAIVMPLALTTGASYFEAATVLALLHFSRSQVDVEILEAGVGAKLDATTAIPAQVGLLTSIALDHQAWLGDTVEDIAKDKAYVFDGCLVKMSAPQTQDVINILQNIGIDIQYSKHFNNDLSMLGQYQKDNAGLALSAFQAIAKTIETLDVNLARDAISQVKTAGRLECHYYHKHHFWLDAAHNEHAIEALLPTIAKFDSPLDVIFLCTREDRDLSMCVPKLNKYTRKVVVMTGADAHDYNSIYQALSSEVPQFTQGKFLVLGSFITIDEVLSWMEDK